jgi:hypothetical protein
MSRQPIKPEEWWLGAATLMVKYDLSLREAAQELGIELTIAEADALSKRVLFREILEKAKKDYFSEIGPQVSKEQIEGLLYQLAERLAADREDAKASEALLRLAKVKGIVGFEPDSLYKTLSVLSAEEIDEVKQNLKQQQQSQEPQPAEKPLEPKVESSKVVN